MGFKSQYPLFNFKNYVLTYLAYLLSKIPVKNILIKIVLGEYYDKNIEMIYTDNLKSWYYLILAVLIVDYKDPILITKIKVNLKYFICYISL